MTDTVIPSLGSAFATRKMRFGMAFDDGVVTGQDEATRIKRGLVCAHATTVTPENCGKFDTVHPKQGEYDFTHVFTLSNFAKSCGMQFFYHTGLWYYQLPTWITTGKFTQLEWAKIAAEHMQMIASQMTGVVSGIEIANEVYSSSGLRGEPWLSGIGPHFVEISSLAVRQSNRSVRRYYNSFYHKLEFTTEGAVNVLPDEVAIGETIRLAEEDYIEGVGIQLHIYAGTDLSKLYRGIKGMAKALRRSKTLIRFSEVGVKYGGEFGGEKNQADSWGEIAELALDVGAIEITQWGINDPAWRGNTTMFYPDGSPKPSYSTVYNIMRKKRKFTIPNRIKEIGYAKHR